MQETNAEEKEGDMKTQALALWKLVVKYMKMLETGDKSNPI